MLIAQHFKAITDQIPYLAQSLLQEAAEVVQTVLQVRPEKMVVLEVVAAEEIRVEEQAGQAIHQ